MSNDTLLVSLTSHPPRVTAGNPFRTIQRLLNAIENIDAKIILNLSLNEFPNRENDLPSNLVFLCYDHDVEIYFDEGNIKAHKKLLPTIERYPDNDILVVDDDKFYYNDICTNFLEAHRLYPKDVIIGRCHFRVAPVNNKLIGIPIIKDLSKTWEKPLSKLYNCKQASGLAGTYYPAHTFTNHMFFDRKLMMSCCEESDEDWQFLFNIMEDMTLRTNIVITEYPDNCGFTSCSLCKMFGQNYYNQYYDNFLKIYPELYDKLLYLDEQFKKEYPEFMYS